VDIDRERERDPRDHATSPPLRMGLTGPINDDEGAPMPCPGATCGKHPSGTSGAGLPGRTMGDVRRVLWVHPRPG
jgi:hypothetical protein